MANHALQFLLDAHHGYILHHVRAQGVGRAGEGWFGEIAVARHYHLLKQEVVRLHDDIQPVACAGNTDFLCLHADVGNHQDVRVSRDVEWILSVDVRNDALPGFSFYGDGGTDEGLSVFGGGDGALQDSVLSKGMQARRQEDRYQEKCFDFCHNIFLFHLLSCKGKCKSQSKGGNGALNNVTSCIRMIQIDKEKAGLDKWIWKVWK